MSLYPALAPFDQFELRVDATHTLHVERCGNPDGEPVVVLHGGPGGGCNPDQRRYFDPQHWHIILFDQRGAGRSRPYASLENNTLAHLLADMEMLRERLALPRWALFGGSWGSTLALHYALAFAPRVSAMVLRGIFLARQQDLDWLYTHSGAAAMKPDAWQQFVAPLAPGLRHQPLPAYYQRLRDDSNAQLQQDARAWAAWEAACATLLPSEQVSGGFDRAALALARIETHFFAGPGMHGAEPILERMAAIADVPAWLVHGRYDLVCKPEQAWDLHQAWPGSRLRWVEGAGHSAAEAGIRDALVTAVAEMAARLGVK